MVHLSGTTVEGVSFGYATALYLQHQIPMGCQARCTGRAPCAGRLVNTFYHLTRPFICITSPGSSAITFVLFIVVLPAVLLPAPLFGPLLGILGVYAADRGDLADVKKTLFGDKKGQFKAG